MRVVFSRSLIAGDVENEWNRESWNERLYVWGWDSAPVAPTTVAATSSSHCSALLVWSYSRQSRIHGTAVRAGYTLQPPEQDTRYLDLSATRCERTIVLDVILRFKEFYTKLVLWTPNNNEGKSIIFCKMHRKVYIFNQLFYSILLIRSGDRVNYCRNQLRILNKSCFTVRLVYEPIWKK